MKLGKVSDTIFDRSVFKLIGRHGKDNIRKPVPGQDAGRLNTDGASSALISTATGKWAVYKAVNNICAAGGTAKGVSVCITMNEKAREIRLKEIMKEIDHECALAQVQLMDGHTTVSNVTEAPIITATALGLSDNERGTIAPNQDIIMTRHIGISGIRRIIELKGEEILKVYMPEVIERAAGREEDMLVCGAVNALKEAGFNLYMHDVSEGGIFAALWDMAEYGNVGLSIDFRAIRVCQEIIEICEMFNVNPYCLESLGCLLMTSENGCDILNTLNACGIEAAIVGRTTDGNQRIIHNQEEDRFMELPAQDEIFKFI
ncbi:MAG: AIR synthase related protein [Lachnospira sp.]